MLAFAGSRSVHIEHVKFATGVSHFGLIAEEQGRQYFAGAMDEFLSKPPSNKDFHL